MRNNVYNFIHNNNLRNIDVFLKKSVLFTAYPKVFNKLSTPIESLGREICQNSGDARKNKNKPVEVEFKTFEINTDELPDIEKLRDAINRGEDFWKSQNNLHYFNNSAFVICKTVMYAYYSSVIAKYFYETLDFA